MKLVLLVLPFLLSTFSLSQKNKSVEILNTSPIIENVLYMANTEVSNFQYAEYLFHLKNNNSKNYSSAIQDTNVWSDISYKPKYTSHYHLHPAYREYPVVGLTKEQAKGYCDWLTVILNQKFASDKKHPVKTVKVRLPLEKEWKTAAQAGNMNAIFSWQGDSPYRQDKKFKGSIKGNYQRQGATYTNSTSTIDMDVTAPVKSYWPNAFNFYNLSGNVSELLLDSDYAIGGSWHTPLAGLEINAENDLREKAEPSASVGFRYVVEITSFKNKATTKSLTAKMIDDLLIEVDTNFMMFKTEVTNQLYRYFIEDANNGIHKPSSKNWNKVSIYGELYQNDYFSHSKYQNFPVVNISYESATAFCQWLTKKYNQLEKKKYTNLTFALPTEEQWMKAAKGKLSKPVYPWGGPYVRNSQGCFLANFFPIDERFEYYYQFDDNSEMRLNSKFYDQKANDGAVFTCAVDSYFSNGYGLYNMAGNVNEMVEGKKCKGGSWLSYSYFLQIIQHEPYEGATPYTGFRVIARK